MVVPLSLGQWSQDLIDDLRDFDKLQGWKNHLRNEPGVPVAAHVFASLDLRAVARDIFLDGNTFLHSHRVDRRPYVADVAPGIAGFAYGWKFSYARVLRSREFEGQPSRDSYGAFTLTYAFN